MTDNTIKANGIEVYTHDIYLYADQFIQEELGSDGAEVKENFARLILYIADRIQKPSHDDIALLDGIFQIYVRLCLKYGALPSIEMFAQLTKTNRATFGDWARGEYRANNDTYSTTVKAWRETCRSFVVDKLHNSDKVNVNLIFIAKANYGMKEAVSEPIEEYDASKPVLSAHEIHKAFIERKKPKPEIHFDDDGNVLDVNSQEYMLD